MQVLNGTRPCRFVGGPLDKQAGEYVDSGQTEAYFGSKGGFVYRYDDKATAPGQPAVWRYDAKASDQRLRDLGVIRNDEMGLYR